MAGVHWKGEAIELADIDQPIVQVRFFGRASDAEFAVYLEELSRMIDRRCTPNTMVIDAGESGPAPPSQRKMQGEWLRRNAGRIRRLNLGIAFVIRSPVIRGTMTAVFWLARLPVPHTVVATPEAARAWCEGQLNQHRTQSTAL